MKKHLILAAMAITALFNACSNEEEPVTTGNEVTFVIGGVDSRTTTTFGTNGTTTVFADNDKIGIFSTGLDDTEMENVEYTYTIANGLTSSATYNFPANGSEVTFQAYYPYTTTITDGENINSSVDANQSELTNFNKSDFLYASETGSSTTSSNGVELTFNHMLALVEVELGTGFTSSLEDGETVSNVSINAIRSFTFPLGTAVATILQGTPETIYMYNNTTTDKYYAIIPAQTITGDGTTAMFTITTSEGRAFSYKPSAGSTETFTQGQTTKIKLNATGGTSNLTVFKVASVTINDWDKDRPNQIIQNEYNVTEEEIEPLNITATLPTVGDIKTLTNGRGDLTEAGWGAYGLASATVVEDTENGNYIKITGASTLGSWPNNTLFYWAGSAQMQPNKTYTLKFKAKTTVTDNSLNFGVGKKDVNCMFRVEEANNYAYKSIKLTTEYKEYTIVINPAYYSTGMYGNSNSENADNSDICISFRANTIDAIYHIKEVSFVQN